MLALFPVQLSTNVRHSVVHRKFVALDRNGLFWSNEFTSNQRRLSHINVSRIRAVKFLLPAPNVRYMSRPK